MDRVKYFTDEYSFLSNFHEAEIEYIGIKWKTSEHAYQAMKSVDHEERLWMASLEHPGQAKRAGRHLTLRADWEAVKEDLMEGILRAKFDQHEDLKQQLIETYPIDLIEGNSWGDTYWGVDDKKGGLNKLGKILMKLRVEYSGR